MPSREGTKYVRLLARAARRAYSYPKCPRCALVTVCLPDEIRALSGSSLAPRSIAVPADEALPLVVQSQHARIGKEGETLKITDDEQGETRVRFIDREHFR